MHKSRKGSTEGMEARKRIRSEEEMIEKIENIRTQLEEEVEKLRKEAEKKIEGIRKEWKKENDEIKIRLERIEMDMERKERQERRNNIVIKGREFLRQDLEKRVEKFLEDSLELKVKVKKAMLLGKDKKVTVVKLDEQEKKEIMKRKKNLGKDIFIENDMTWKEKGIQQEVVKMAKIEKEKGNKVKIGYKMLTINGKKWKWIERSKKLEEMKLSEERKEGEIGN